MLCPTLVLRCPPEVPLSQGTATLTNPGVLLNEAIGFMICRGLEEPLPLAP